MWSHFPTQIQPRGSFHQAQLQEDNCLKYAWAAEKIIKGKKV